MTKIWLKQQKKANQMALSITAFSIGTTGKN